MSYSPRGDGGFSVRIVDICVIIITIFVVLAYFKGWG
jgi:hypothetical protein